jgi:hypothetical protein
MGLGGLLLLPVLLATGSPLAASWANAAVGAYLALVPVFTGYLLFGWGLASVCASTATTLSLLEPAVAAILAVTVVGERLPVPAGPASCSSPGALSSSPSAAAPFCLFFTWQRSVVAEDCSTAVTLLRVCLGTVAKSVRPGCNPGRPMAPVVA